MADDDHPTGTSAAHLHQHTAPAFAPRPPADAESQPLPHRRGKRLSPGLELRLQKLVLQRRRKEEAGRRLSIGRIPEEQLEELERRHRADQVIDVRRRSTTWTGPPGRVMPAGGVRLSGGPVLTDNEASALESDVSSVIDISDHWLAPDTDDERDALQDTHKYRMPDTGKTRLHLRTKEPLSPRPKQSRTDTGGCRQDASAPQTPRTAESSPKRHPSPRTAYSTNWINSSAENLDDRDFVGSGISRANSIYTLGRASFTGQLSQLTAMQLPDANSLAKRISSIPNPSAAAKALSDASDQIRLWISKATDVLNALNAEDDVEWAAAGGRDGIAEVDDAINRFEQLVQVYILSIDRFQTRADVAQLSAGELNLVVKQMENIIASWKKIQDHLQGIKEQVEIAMEWEELWNSVLGEIGQEMEGLNRLVFEMEEKRHQSTEGLFTSRDTIDISELETIVGEHPGRMRTLTGIRSSLPPFSPASPTPPAESTESRDDASLLALFARMQPLRASLDFLPMRLSVFHVRGNGVFPTACLDLESRRDQLEDLWRRLEADAESLRRELGEDRWVLVFRNAGRQALKMCESIARSFSKLKDAVDAGEQHTNFASLTKKIENYEAKKTHYGPAIERVLAIIDRGVLDRLTVNGEILRLQSDMKRKWTALQTEMRELDSTVETVHDTDSREKQLRDSVSTVVSNEPSVGSSLVETPGSSPASSVGGTSRKNSLQGSRTPTPLTTLRISTTSASHSQRLPAASSIPRRIPLTRLSDASYLSTPSPSPTVSALPKSSPAPSSGEPQSRTTNRPRWTSAVKPETRDFLPLSAFEPSPYAKAPIVQKHSFLRSTTGPGTRTSVRAVSSPMSTNRPFDRSSAASSTSRKSSLPVPAVMSTPSPAATKRPSPLNPKASMSSLRPASRQAVRRSGSSMPTHPPTDGNEADSEGPAHHNKRPPSGLATMRSSPHSSGSGHTDEGPGRPKWRV